MDSLTPCRYNAGTALLVAYDKNNVYTYPGDKRNSGIEDATIVATHLVLGAKAAGVDSCWVNRFNPEEAAKTFGLPENEEVLCFIDLGYPSEGAGPLANHQSRKALEETTVLI
ncbi:MAG: nitroreductase family protein [Sphaerochaetaceae bacterium]|nr:nitroreductase family protein [Sphaerochaetaceae bacterium]